MIVPTLLSDRVTEKLDALRYRLLNKPLDALTTASLSSHRHAASYPRPLGRARSSRYDRVRSAVRLIDLVVPGTSRFLERCLLEFGRLPLDASVELLSSGTGKTVFLLRWPDSEGKETTKVLKVYRRSLGRRSSALLALVKRFRNTYETNCLWYQEGSLVIPTSFLVLHGPLLAWPAVACLQPYIEGDKEDFFDQRDTELVRLIRTNRQLRSQYEWFVRRTFEILERDNRCIDVMGKDNLLLVKDDGQIRMQLIDFGLVNLTERQRITPRVAARIRHRLKWLRSIYDRVYR